jgi:TonB family protein
MSEPFLLFAAFSLASLAAFAQETTPSPPNDPAAFLLRAAESNGLPKTGGQPWHLKVSFKLFDELGNIKDQGTAEEFYISPAKFKKIYSSSGYSHTVFGTQNGLMYTGDHAGPSPPIRPFPDIFVNPIPMSLASADHTLSAEHRSSNGADQLCIGVSTSPVAGQPVRPHSTYCFDPETGVLQSSVFEALGVSQVWNQPITFQGHWLSRSLEVQSRGKDALSAHLDFVEPIMTVDEAIFRPPPDATTQEIVMVGIKGNPFGAAMSPHPVGGNGQLAISGGVAQGLLVQKMPVMYPPVAKAARVQGTVVLQARIAKDGSVAELKVISGHPMLLQAAIDSVKQWVYRPYLLAGNPVEVLTTVNVIFTLAEPPKTPTPTP